MKKDSSEHSEEIESEEEENLSPTEKRDDSESSNEEKVPTRKLYIPKN